jgi:hypothetical protein
MSSIRRDDAASLLDGLLGRVARGRGALDVAVGDGLAALAAGDRVLRLGYSSVGDYAVERLGIQKSTAEKMARLALALRERPLLREAVWRGEVSARKAEAVLRVARGEAEAEWVARARVGTVRALGAEARAAEAAAAAAATANAPGTSTASGDGVPGEDEAWTRVVIPLSPEQRARFDEAVALARKLLGATAPRWQCLEALCTEYLGAHPVELPDDESSRGARAGADGETLKAWLEAKDEPQMCARGDVDLRMPRRVATLLGAAFRAVRGATGERLSPGACLERLATHFIETWEPVLRERNTVQKRVRERDRGRCQVPGCSRAASHVHHVLYRSAGGGDEGENLVSLCAAHHLHCIHLGWIRVRGRAPTGSPGSSACARARRPSSWSDRPCARDRAVPTLGSCAPAPPPPRRHFAAP